MKKIISSVKLVLVAVVTVLSLSSCDDNEDSVTASQIDTSGPELNALDLYLRENFVTPYNIDILYRWDINNVDIGRYLYPPAIESVQPLADVMTKVWIEPYTELGGENFIKNIAPREFIYSGGFNYNPDSPTITLGIAEQGARITFFNVDFLNYDVIDYNSINSIVSPVQTMQHEYLHILNQLFPYDRVFDDVNPQGYTSNWTERNNTQAREQGYITAYAGSQAGEDYAEMVSQMLTRSRSQFDALVDGISNAESREAIREKERLVVEYYEDNFDIDFYELQELTYQALISI